MDIHMHEHITNEIAFVTIFFFQLYAQWKASVFHLRFDNGNGFQLYLFTFRNHPLRWMSFCFDSLLCSLLGLRFKRFIHMYRQSLELFGASAEEYCAAYCFACVHLAHSSLALWAKYGKIQSERTIEWIKYCCWYSDCAMERGAQRERKRDSTMCLSIMHLFSITILVNTNCNAFFYDWFDIHVENLNFPFFIELVSRIFVQWCNCFSHFICIQLYIHLLNGPISMAKNDEQEKNKHVCINSPWFQQKVQRFIVFLYFCFLLKLFLLFSLHFTCIRWWWRWRHSITFSIFFVQFFRLFNTILFFLVFFKDFFLFRAMSMKLSEKKCVFLLKLLLTKISCESSNVSIGFFILVFGDSVSFSHSSILLSLFLFCKCFWFARGWATSRCKRAVALTWICETRDSFVLSKIKRKN